MNELISPAELARRERMEKKAKRRLELEAMKVDDQASRISLVVLLYYKYVKIDNPEKFAAQHLKWCKEQGVKGRILVSTLGINGTCSGTRAQMDEYIRMMHSDPRFSDMMFKEDIGDQFTFTKLFVRVKEELVTSRIPGLTAEGNGQHLNPTQWNEMIEKFPDDVVLIDMRNKYEWEIGRFKNALPLEMDSFRQLPEAIDQIEHLKDKKIMAYCTGGVRCETGTTYLKNRGFKEVYQLEGGIHTYGKQYPDRHWEGEMFVFDRRVSVPINKTKDLVISKCLHCAETCNVYINCVNAVCNALFISCEKCAAKMENACSTECQQYQRDPNQKDYMSMIQRRYASRRQMETNN